MGFFNKLFGDEKNGQTVLDRAQELNSVLIVAGYREIAKQTGFAPTSKTSDAEIIAMYGKVGTAFHMAAEDKGERLSAGIKNRIVLCFLQIKESSGDKFTEEHLDYEIQKYLREGLRDDYKKDPINLISILGLDQNQQDYQELKRAASKGNSQAQS